MFKRLLCTLLISQLITPSLFGAAQKHPDHSKNYHLSIVGQNGMPKNIVKRASIWNFGPGALWTHKGWQYAAYWDDARRVSVGRRQLPDGPWQVISLPGYERTENINRGKGGAISQGFGDGHEKVSMGISSDGVIHLAFDHHLSTLHYRKTKLPVANTPEAYEWNASLFGDVQDNLGGPKIESVTYPQFTPDGDRLILYLRLNGGSGSADSYFFEYQNGQWQINAPSPAKIIDKNWSGGDKTVNAYPHGLIVRNDRWHLTWCWRDTPTARTSHDLCYAYSDDHGQTWTNNDGQLVCTRGSRFITADTPGIAAVKIPSGKRYINGGSMTVDRNGRLHVLTNGLHYYFTRDPKTEKWTHRKSSVEGILVPGRDDDLYIVSENGIKRTSTSDFGQIESLATWPKSIFEDSRMCVDRTRFDADDWISVIGQNGKTVTVIDYCINPVQKD